MSKNASCFEEVASFIITTTSEAIAIRRPSKTTNFLAVDHNATKQPQGSQKSEEAVLVSGGPFNRIEINVACFIPNEKLFCLNRMVALTA